ncbi:MAG: OsmC family peroxiredoxin [Alphaproteobacteria bacterium]|nr:OsmC family peroxiredoxin [Alphaproteobacteria bacterium]
MDASDLRGLRAPLKERYRQNPATALVTLSSRGRIDMARVAVELDRAPGPAFAGLHPATGGDGTMLCSGDMLLEALAACAGVTLAAVATAMGIGLRAGEVAAEGEVDFRGTLGVDKEARVGFGPLRVAFILDSDASDAQLAKLLTLTERYCVVGRTLSQPAGLSMTFRRLG